MSEHIHHRKVFVGGHAQRTRTGRVKAALLKRSDDSIRALLTYGLIYGSVHRSLSRVHLIIFHKKFLIAIFALLFNNFFFI